jgi:hypothetical protein
VSRVTHRGCCHECLRDRSLCRACECDYLVLVVVPVLDGVNHTLHCPAGGDTRPRSASIAPQQAQDGCRVLKVSASLKDYITALPQRAWRHPEAQLTATPRVPCSKLWVPASQRSVDFSSRQNPENMVYAGQGPPPPNPLVVERFQQVVSALFQQASVWKGGGDCCRLATPATSCTPAAAPGRAPLLGRHAEGAAPARQDRAAAGPAGWPTRAAAS